MAALIALLSAGLLSGTASGRTARFRYYEGSTPEGAIVRIKVGVSENGAVWLRLLWVTQLPYSCEDGTEGKTGRGAGWDPRGPLIQDQHLELNLDSGATTMSGRLGMQRGSGTMKFVMAGLTADEHAQVCMTDVLAWTVERAASVGFPFGRAAVVQRPAGGRMVMMGGHATTHDRETIGAQVKARPIRHYEGRTSAELGVKVKTQRVDTGIKMVDLAFGYDLACEDGSNIRGRWVRFFTTPPTVMQPGRFDMDDTTVGPGVAMHVHGELDQHLGTGTLAYIQPELTEELDAQLCTTGELTWQLWRIDQGY